MSWDSYKVPGELNFHEIPMELTIYMDDRPKQIKGVRVGDLIVHRHPSMWETVFVVSHVPTLVSFEKAVLDEPDDTPYWSERRLIDWCKKVQQSLREDWELLSTLNIRTYNNNDSRHIVAAKDRIQKHCLAVTV